MNRRVGIPAGLHAEGNVFDDAQKPVAHVDTRMGQQLATIDRRKNPEQNRNLDRAGGVEPAIGVIVDLESSLAVVQGDGNSFGARLLLDLLDLVSHSALAGAGGAGARRLRFCFRHRAA